MKRIISLFILLIAFVAFSFSQVKREKRIYYLDCSYSMVTPNGIWNEVCNNLKKAIDNVEDETTSLIVIPFAFDGGHYNTLEAFVENATDEGKNILKKHIDDIKPDKHSKTYHSNVLNDFYANRVDEHYITYMFLMTDGKNEENPDKFIPLLRQWKNKYGTKEVYGFYVMLSSAAQYSNAEKIINQENDHFWMVQTADVNINLIRLDKKVFFNARNKKHYVDIRFSGDLSKTKLKISGESENSNYKVVNYEKKNGYLRVYLEVPTNLSTIPQEESCKVSLQISDSGDFDFFLTDEIEIICENKKVNSVNPTFNE